MILHAGCVARRVRGAWRGVLLAGPSGSGKSDLALRLLEHGWRLVADDRTVVWTSSGQLFGRAPVALNGLMEVRGIDVLPFSALRFAGLALQADCGPETDRLPEPRTVEILGARLPAIGLAPLHASAPAKLSQALDAALRRRPLDSSIVGRI